MSQALLMVPTESRVGLTTVSIGLLHALDLQGLRVGFFKPMAQLHESDNGPERSTQLVKQITSLNPPEPISTQQAMYWMANNAEERLLEEVIDRYSEVEAESDIIVVEGLVPTDIMPYADQLNARLAKGLDARIIYVAAPRDYTADELSERLELTAQDFGGLAHQRNLGVILNRVGAPSAGHGWFDYQDSQHEADVNTIVAHLVAKSRALKQVQLIGAIPWNNRYLTPRVCDVAPLIAASYIHEGNSERRIKDIVVGAGNLALAAERMHTSTLFITAGDRDDLLLTASMAALNGDHLAGIILTNGLRPGKDILQLCHKALATGLPILSVANDSFQTALNVRKINLELPINDARRLQDVLTDVVRHLDMDWVRPLLSHQAERRLSPPAFRHMLVEKARAARKRIVLPEGDEPRTIKAANICQRRGIADCILLAKAERVREVAVQQGVDLSHEVTIIDPDEVRSRYIEPMVALRKHKGLSPQLAEEALLDNVYLGTMMLKLDEVDGLVSGAVHTTANTIRPAFQLIKTPPGVKLVSSIFFMCLPEQVLVYGDCAVNPDPSAEQLADIAIQSALSAKAFGIEPRVALISYSTGTSGEGADVEKVREATRIAQAERPDILIDGPLQYDAAAVASVAQKKAPESKVAGNATVFVFPDLNTGNTTYKAVQRSADVISIGPMLQGLKKPVNDLSRGALVEDIIYTIALTAIQAEQAMQDSAV